MFSSVTPSAILGELGIADFFHGEKSAPAVYSKGFSMGNSESTVLTSVNPSDNQVLAEIKAANQADLEKVFADMKEVQERWNQTPAPKRGEVVQKIGLELRKHKSALGKLIALENGKILAEGEGEVQEAIDICDFAVGLSRTYSGSIIPSERPGHFMMERWNPLKGYCGIISAFNFPVAVYFWNLALSLVVGNVNIWKPSDTTPLISLSIMKIMEKVLKEEQFEGVATMVLGSGSELGASIVKDPRVELVSFTGSTKVGREVSTNVAARFGKSLLELGGNNGTIIMNDADLDLALRAVLFSAVGTCGQRCTSLRRLFVHSSIYDEFVNRLLQAYKTVTIGSPLEEGVLCGPLHTKSAVKNFLKGVEEIKEHEKDGAKILCGGFALDRPGNFVQPTIVETPHHLPFVQSELFAPILYVIKINDLDEAITLNNSVSQGLSSSLFTKDQAAIFKWSGHQGSDCGIVNVNIGPSGAEIGGAFGGEKETGGGRESGSDSWKAYCRRTSCTINYSNQLPLAQGINFG